MKWTNEQNEAIELREKNILVSAAAGSGKTAVLVERIKRLIIDENFSVDKMLIVTFTNLAASEMKAKIRTSLQQASKNETDLYKIEYLQKQISLLSRANISTFHSFALEVLSDFYYIINIEPSFKICDDADSTILKRESLDRLFKEFFESEDKDFIEFLYCYSSEKNENVIKDNIDKIYDMIRSLPHPWEFLEKSVTKLSLTLEDFLNSDNMLKVWELTIKNINEAISSNDAAIKALIDVPSLESKLIFNEKEIYESLLKAAKKQDVNSVKNILDLFKPSTLRATKEEQKDYESVKLLVTKLREIGKGKIKELKNLIFSEELQGQVEKINATYKMGLIMEKLIHRYDELFTNAKKAKGLIDFNDIEHCCFNILSQKEAQDYYRNKFEHIFIDEYQDTNILQEAIINCIKRDNNLFMVGDIKQSIYKFRLAEPKIFKEKYELYRDGGDIHSEKIDLNKNYRSKGNIINYVNVLFENVMAGYDDDAKLYEGISSDKAINYKPELRLLASKDIIENNEELEEYKKAELEAIATCDVIKEYLGKPFYDSKNDKLCKFKKKDMVILVRSAKNYADVFYKTLKEANIEAHIDDTDGYLDSVEINLVLNLLMIVNNRYQDVPFLATLYSSIFNFTLDELGEIRRHYQKGSYVEAFETYSEVGINPSLAKKCKITLEKIEKWRSFSQTMPLDKFIWEILKETDYYIITGAMPKGEVRQGNLRILIEKARGFHSQTGASLYTFVKYIETVKERKVSMPQVKQTSENDDIVRIMTIHKSKGLEFPLVIIPGISRKKNNSNKDTKIYVHKDIGIGLSYINLDENIEQKTLIQTLIEKTSLAEEYEEEERVFYVGLTRPKDALILIGTTENYEDFLESKENNIVDNKTFLNMTSIAGVELKLIDNIHMDTDKTTDYHHPMKFNPSNIDVQVQQEIDKRMKNKYNYLPATISKEKYSVSELNSLQSVNKNNDEQNIIASLRKPNFLHNKVPSKISAADKGNIYHKILQKINLTMECDLKDINEQCDNLTKRNVLTELELKEINLHKIARFLNSEIGIRLRNAAKNGSLFREVPFTMYENINNDEILVQGIIDCYFLEDDELVLIDYKSR